MVGSLTACFFARRGHHVRVYEYRSDIRVEDSKGPSIDLALSFRGREALKKVGLEDALISQHGIPMRGRMLHEKDGSLKEVIYDKVQHNCIYSVSRKYLNEVLLNGKQSFVERFDVIFQPLIFKMYGKNSCLKRWAAEKYPNVHLKFNEKLLDADLDAGRMKFLDTKTNIIEETHADLIIGGDGAYSTVRKIMMKRPRFNFSQTYIEHGYVEIYIPPGKNNEYLMSNNHLHIWPRGEFMMIALPNDDKSFTGNLFAPFDILLRLNTAENIIEFYQKQFPDVVPLIGKERLLEIFLSSEPKTLISVKCKPFHVGNTALLVGDAAHAMVPFYAQGMNAGFEDVLILDELMERYNSDLSKVLPAFSKIRCDDAHAICDLAMYNYIEMRDLVRKRSFLFRKYLDTILQKLFPKTWIPLYSTVHFTRMEFCKCISNKAWQDKILRRIFWCLAAVSLATFIALASGKTS
ncbi:kynurenine 3-monooxygenase isoform X2 [Orussus abietinus]|uniref:kynurenine 3-monooxygenase isoform X2 n=1 Tax=Orussus abietinus TaxID=222816 RepID=UPI0006265E18|nr:kynurenine 3-monooxygenase isoform X2 [Orussus abietinus]